MNDMERAREIAHIFTKCTGGRPAGDDGHRWHTRTCDERSRSIAAALAAARREALKDAADAIEAKSDQYFGRGNEGRSSVLEEAKDIVRDLIEKQP